MMWLRMLAAAVAILIALFLMPWWMPRSWYRAMLYPGGKPNRFARRINSAWARVFSHGVLPQFLVTLETRGRHTGGIHRIPMVVADVAGNRYLVSMKGEHVDWVRNVRAANGEASLLHGSVERVILQEVPPEARAPILKAYLARAAGARPHFDVDWNAPLPEFERIAARYPVFRVMHRGTGR